MTVRKGNFLKSASATEHHTHGLVRGDVLPPDGRLPFPLTSATVQAMRDTTAGPTSNTYFSQRLRLHYVDWGRAGKPPLLLLHGGRDHCRNWDWTAAALRDDWHVIAPDLRGHGDSQWSQDGSYAMTGYIYDLAQLIHQQRLAPVTIIAHSLGGNIALRYAGVYPETVAKLVAIEGLGPPPRVLAERREKTIAERMAEWIREQRGFAGGCPGATRRSRMPSGVCRKRTRISPRSRRAI